MLQNDGVKADDESNKDGVNRGELRVESEALPQALDSETKWNAAGQSAVVIDDGRWACPRCTYINYSKSTRCSMCTAPLACDSTEAENCYQISSSKLENESAAQFRNPSPVPSSSCVEPTFRSSSSLDGFNVGENRNNFDQEAPICVNNPKGPQTMELIESVAISSQAKIDSASLADELESNQASHIILDSSQKWSCPRCTFYNWPKSRVCVVCRAPPNWTKNRNPSGDASNSDSFSKSRSPEVVSSDEGSGGSSISLNDPKAARKLTKQKWQCIYCSCDNLGKVLKCVTCGKKRVLSVPDDQQNRDGQKISPPVTINRKGGGKTHPRTREAVFTIDERLKKLSVQKRGPVVESKKKAIPTGEPYGKEITQPHEQKYFQSNNRFSVSKLDWMYLQACWAISVGAVDPVEAYLAAGGDKKRALSAYEATVLDIPGVVERLSLTMIAILFKRPRIIEMLMSHEKPTTLNSPIRYPACAVSSDLTNQIMRTISNSMRMKGGSFKCAVFQDNVQTFGLPAEIHRLPRIIQKMLMGEILDQSVKRELEVENCVINWSREVAVKLKSKLRPLWNRTAGDCLLDAVLQATWGVFDSQNLLRKSLAETLRITSIPSHCQSTNSSSALNLTQTQLSTAAGATANSTHSLENIPSQFQTNRALYQRWAEQEVRNASEVGFSLDGKQLEEEWATLARLAAQPGQPLEQLHIFVLAHILRRPIIVYGVRMIKSFRGEEISPAKFEGVYLPLLWEASFCNRNPICLSYTPGHFSALVTLENPTASSSGLSASSGTPNSTDAQCQVCSSGTVYSQQNDAPMQHCAAHRAASPNPHNPQKFESPNYYLPLVDADLAQLPVHFLLNSEAGQEDILLNQMLDCIVTPGGILVARFLSSNSSNNPHNPTTTPLPCPSSGTHPLVHHMNDLWLERYRLMASSMNQSEDEDESNHHHHHHHQDDVIDNRTRSRTALFTNTIQ
ncbi:ubiquitin thioesterase zranb1-B-like [Convolutriloba macropyga]|uniref:ubiquitin thioesterase zranb1-B-like n=1 Tax=Convolutriloba macropyga TaxID=536237 RepID=UPI003F527D3E